MKLWLIWLWGIIVVLSVSAQADSQEYVQYFEEDYPDGFVKIHIVVIDRSAPNHELRILARQKDATNLLTTDMESLVSMSPVPVTAALNGYIWDPNTHGGYHPNEVVWPLSTLVLRNSLVKDCFSANPIGCETDKRVLVFSDLDISAPAGHEFSGTAYYAIGSDWEILRNGACVDSSVEGYDGRSAIGWNDDRVILMSTSYPSFKINGGVTGREMCAGMQVYGATHAVLMDGGASVGLFYNNEVKNPLSAPAKWFFEDGHRHIANAIALVECKSTGTTCSEDGECCGGIDCSSGKCGGATMAITCPGGYAAGDYCGKVALDQDPDWLYRCNAGTYTVKDRCVGGSCKLEMDGINDSCVLEVSLPTSTPPLSMPPEEEPDSDPIATSIPPAITPPSVPTAPPVVTPPDESEPTPTLNPTPQPVPTEPVPEPTVPTECGAGNQGPCGNCGVKTCSSEGNWQACTNEGTCAPGEVYDEPCGNGGIVTVICTDSCRFQPGMCTGESSCIPGITETQQCGAVISNAQSRTCDSSGNWSDWGVCAPVGVCDAGERVQESCSVGMNAEGQMVAGTRTQTCQNNGQWGDWGVCEPNPDCSPGEVDSTACNGGNGVQERTCTPSGYWGIWGNCNVSPNCDQGQSQQRSCTVNGQVGLETRPCGANGQWASTWDPCVITPASECVCSSGECCDGCHFNPTGTTCEQGWAYRCQGSSPGQDAEQAQVRTFCSGSSSACNGETVQYSWIIMEDCGNTQVCSTSGGSPHCMANQACTDTFIPSINRSCSTGGSPVLCLEVENSFGSNFEYRLCKDDGSFDNNIKYHLIDDNVGVHFDEYTEMPSSETNCTSWRPFDVQYISGYGAVAGAALRVETISPSTCTEPACYYNSGRITVRKECL